MTSWFDESPETYDRARPSYPEPLWDEVFRRLPGNPSLVEIGPGTGKATAALLARGARVIACEPGPNLTAFLIAKFPGPNLEVRNSGFEEANFGGEQFDGVVAATSFHWVERRARTEKVPSILNAGGLVAIISTNQVDDAVDRGYFAASQQVYRTYFPDEPEEMPATPGRDVTPPEFEELSANPLFEDAELFRYDWDQRYETAAYLDLVRSYSNTAQMQPAARASFLADLGGFIDGEFGGYVTRPLVITLSCSRRRP
ncbi:MAG: class I SAM-dependent methyltransferase [bacterium]